MHVCVCIDGALREPKAFVNYITYNGKLLTTKKQVTDFLLYQKAMGREVLPMCDCEDFDYITGCPGKVVEDEAALQERKD